MVAYEFFRCDKVKGNELIGILPERRSDSGRIDRKSIMRWLSTFLGDHTDMSNIFFLKVTVGKDKVGRRDPGLKRRNKQSREIK